VANQSFGDLFIGSNVTTGVGPAAPAAPMVARLRAIHGVQGVIVVRADLLARSTGPEVARNE
jgi:hypothetical protein